MLKRGSDRLTVKFMLTLRGGDSVDVPLLCCSGCRSTDSLFGELISCTFGNHLYICIFGNSIEMMERKAGEESSRVSCLLFL